MKKIFEMKTFKAGGASTLQALKDYTVRLDKQYDKKAFGYFKRRICPF
jgi:hypothetical protein